MSNQDAINNSSLQRLTRERICMDRDWKFHLGDVPVSKPYWGWTKSGTWNQGGSRKKLDDSNWRCVNLPHDFVIEGTITPSFANDFAEDQPIPEMWSVGNTHTTRGSFKTNIAWYRKKFLLAPTSVDTRAFILT